MTEIALEEARRSMKDNYRQSCLIKLHKMRQMKIVRITSIPALCFTLLFLTLLLQIILSQQCHKHINYSLL